MKTMPKTKYNSEKLWKLYEKLPQELQGAIFSVDTANNIWDVCKRNGVQEISSVAGYTGQVLLGVLPPDEFKETLEKELELKKDVAKKVSQEINRFIFYPVKPALEQLYRIEISPGEKPKEKEESSGKEKEEKPKARPGKDSYREDIE